MIAMDDAQSMCSTPHSDISTYSYISETRGKKGRLNSTGLEVSDDLENSLIMAIKETRSPISHSSIDEIGTFCKFLEMRLRNVNIQTYRRMSHIIMKSIMDIESQLPEYAGYNF